MSVANVEQLGSSPNNSSLNCIGLNCTNIACTNITCSTINGISPPSFPTLYSNTLGNMGTYTVPVPYIISTVLPIGSYQLNAVVQAAMSVAPGGSPPVVVIVQAVMTVTGTAVFAPNTPFGSGGIN